jgi:ferric-dicitrate binding protein FerR (iron transport regulator)
MSDDAKSSANGTNGNGERALRELFVHAAPRPAPPADVEEEIRRALYAEWDAVTGRRVLWRRVGAAVAASVAVAAVTVLVLDTDSGSGGPAVAAVERVSGSVRLVAESGEAPLRAGDRVPDGAVVVTGAGQLALRLPEGGSLRLAPESRARLTGEYRAELLAGTLYFDSENVAGAPQFAVTTPIGTLRDVGTQFMVELDSGRVELGVRDGRVAVERDGERVEANAGEKLFVPEQGNVRRESISTFGGDWQWVEQLAPPFDIDGRQLSEFLDWVAAQTGRDVVFADAAVEQAARATTLRGSIDLEPLPKLAAVMALTDFDYALEDGRIAVTAQ